jgi:hypothetical protein
MQKYCILATAIGIRNFVRQNFCCLQSADKDKQMCIRLTWSTPKNWSQHDQDRFVAFGSRYEVNGFVKLDRRG